MRYGQSNIILLIINIFSYISVIIELICDILDLNLGKIQLQFTVLKVMGTHNDFRSSAEKQVKSPQHLKLDTRLL